MEKLISKTDLAELAGVHVSSVMRLADSNPAISSGKSIKLEHDIVQAYLAKKGVIGPKDHVLEDGTPIKIDPLYSEVAAFCKDRETWSANAIKKNFRIGSTRATKLFHALYDAGIRPGKAMPKLKKPKTVAKAKARPVAADPRTKAMEKKPASTAPTSAQTPTPEPDTETDVGLMEIPADIRELASWPLIKIIRKFGTASGFDTYLKSVKLMEEITERRLKNYKANGELVPKDAVVAQVFEPLDICFARMLRDGSRSITSVMINRVKAGDTFEQCEEEVKKQMSTFIKPVKKKLKGGLKL